ncbi:hypothetical protein QSJ18_03420 [Gordonia sp. ABSL1-1]|uniref:PH-like domain-containing protein n=1 Tax=Gordonia sp. ABSL1-1 TaxID=3053923 RepID=UPI002574241C|nr:hypothetical protein [Gordonia sp. ABSL1-1]MDL9935787.1 hypothetical protein [Gordonia sp. ABSL1-1]
MTRIAIRIAALLVVCAVAVVVLVAGAGWTAGKAIGNVAFIAVIALIVAGLGSMVYLLLTGRATRAAGQTEQVGEFPATPDDLGEPRLPAATGLYLGTTLAPSWQNKITVGDIGDRATTTMTAYPAGVLLDRQGASDIWIPQTSITAARTERGHAGKVMTADGVLVIRWLLPNGTEVDTGIRADDKTIYTDWVRVIAPPADNPEESGQGTHR